MSETKIRFLRNLDIYEGLTDEEIICIARHSVDRSYAKGQQIYTPHEEAPYIYVVKKGEIQLYHHVGGKKVIFNILTPGAVFGCFQNEKGVPTHFAECGKSCYLCITPVDEFLKLVQVYPEMMLRLMQKMADRISEYEEKLEAASGDAATKILFELKRVKEKRSKSFLGKIVPLPLRMTHEEIANITGLNRVTVTRAMRELTKSDKISVDSHTGGITIHV